MRFVVIMDPVATVLPEADTTFALMEELQQRGHRVDHCLNTDLYLDGGRVFARAARATMQRTAPVPVALDAAEDVSTSYGLHANAYVCKPVDFARFHEVIRSIDDFFLTVVRLPTRS